MAEKLEAKKEKITKVCPVCGEEFETFNHRKIYCTTKCTNKHKIRKKRGIVDSDYNKVCPICGKAFRAFRRTEIFCCRACYKKNYERVHKDILAEKRRVYREKNKEEIRGRKKKFYEDNKDSISQKGKIKYSKNKESILSRAKKYYQENKTTVKQRVKKYSDSHRQEICQKALIRYKTDINYRLRVSCREMINRCLSQKKKTSKRIQDILGYSSQELRSHIESYFYKDMNWEDFKLWEIHHIKPISTFNFINEDGTENYNVIKEANALDNLIPLFKDDHKKLTNLYISEKRWLNKEEILEFLSTGEING